MKQRMKCQVTFKARARLMAVAVASCFAVEGLLANPVTPTVVSGSASFSQAGNQLTITNSAGAIINWQGFSIGAGEITRFIQPSSSSTVLNRVVGPDPSLILGQLTSNGRVWLINPAGIMVGPTGRVDVAGFIASTLNVSNQDFLAGRLNFQATPNAGAVRNDGVISTTGGSVYMLAPQVENAGLIQAPGGEVILAAGQAVELIDTATPGVKVEIVGDGATTNVGQILAASGRIGMVGALVRNSGLLNASSVVKDGGRVFLKASKDAYVDGAGRIVATGAVGGRVEVLGERVAIAGTAEVDVSGQQGGGTILVGGDFQGKNPDVQNARQTFVGAGATLKADALATGNGGKVIVWSDGDTRAYGQILARGGAQSGNGGFAEVSGKQHLDYHAKADLRAPAGKRGTLLLDPQDIVIQQGTGDGSFDGNATFYGDYSYTSGLVSANDNSPSTIFGSEIEGQSASADIVLQAGRSITYDSAGTMTSSTLTLASGSSLYLDTRNDSYYDDGLVGGFFGIDLARDGGVNFVTQGAGSINISAGLSGDLPASIKLAGLSSAGPLTIAANNGIEVMGSLSGAGVALNAGTGSFVSHGAITSTATRELTYQGEIAVGVGVGIAGQGVTVNTVDGGAGLVLIDADPLAEGTGVLTVNGGITTTSEQHRLFNGYPDGSGGAVMLNAADMNFAGDVTVGGAGDIVVSNSVGTNVMNLGAGLDGFSLSNSDLAHLRVTPSSTTTSLDGSRLWIVSDGEIHVSEADISGRRAHLLGSQLLDDWAGTYGIRAAHLGLTANVLNIYGANGGAPFRTDAASISLYAASGNTSIKDTSVSATPLLLREATNWGGNLWIESEHRGIRIEPVYDTQRVGAGGLFLTAYNGAVTEALLGDAVSISAPSLGSSVPAYGSIDTNSLHVIAGAGIELSGMNSVADISLANTTSGDVNFTNHLGSLTVSSVINSAGNVGIFSRGSEGNEEVYLPSNSVVRAYGNVTIDVGSAYGGLTGGDIRVASGASIVSTKSDSAISLSADRDVILSGYSELGSVPVRLGVGTDMLATNVDVSVEAGRGAYGGVWLTEAEVVSNGGDIFLAGNRGLYSLYGNATGVVVNSSTLDAQGGSGLGAITISGAGGSLDQGAYLGIGIDVANSSLLTTHGGIQLTGSGATGYSSGISEGVSIAYSTLETSGNGAIQISGTSHAQGDYQRGLFISESNLTTAGTGGISLLGQGSVVGQCDNTGVMIMPDSMAPGYADVGQPAPVGSRIETLGSGSITIRGYGGGMGADYTGANSGVVLGHKTTVAAHGGDIGIVGIAGPGGHGNEGVVLRDHDPLVMMEGYPYPQYDANLRDGARLVNTGAGNITVIGNAKTSAVDANNAPDGVGYIRSGPDNVGVYLGQGGGISAAAGTVTVKGYGGGGTDTNVGVGLRDGGQIVTTLGDVYLKGEAMATGLAANGISLVNSSFVDAGGNLDVWGYNFSGSVGDGVHLSSSALKAAGDIFVLGSTFAASGYGVALSVSGDTLLTPMDPVIEAKGDGAYQAVMLQAMGPTAGLFMGPGSMIGASSSATQSGIQVLATNGSAPLAEAIAMESSSTLGGAGVDDVTLESYMAGGSQRLNGQIIANGVVTLKGSGAPITQGVGPLSGITADTLVLSGSGGANLLTGHNVINTLAASHGGDVSLRVVGGLVIGSYAATTGVTLTSFDLQSGNLILQANGSVSETAPLVVNAVEVINPGGSVTLDHTGNEFAQVIVASRDAINVYSNVSLSLGADPAGPDGLAHSGLVNDGTSSITVTSHGNLSIDQAVNAGSGAVRLTASAPGATLAVSAPVAGGDVTFVADLMDLVAPASASNSVTYTTASSDRAIYIGAGVMANALKLDLSQLASAPAMVIGDVDNAGGIFIGNSSSESVYLPQVTTLANPAGSLTFASRGVGSPGVQVLGSVQGFGRINVLGSMTFESGSLFRMDARYVNAELVADSVTNRGEVQLRNVDPTANAALTSSLTLSSGVFDNQASGWLTFDQGTASGYRYLNAALHNSGNVLVAVPTVIGAVAAQHQNSGNIQLLSVGDLTVNQDAAGSFFQNSGTTTIDPGRSMVINGGNYTHAGGSLAGGGTFNFNGGAASDVQISGALSMSAIGYNIYANDILFTGTGSLSTQGSATLVSTGGIASTSSASTLINTSAGGGSVVLEAQGGSIGSAAKPLTINAGTGLVRATALAAGSDVYLRGTGSNLKLDQVSASRTLSLTSAGGMTLSGSAGAESVLMQAGGAGSLLTINNAANVAATGVGGLQLLADRMDLSNAGMISSAPGTLTLRPVTSSAAITLGATGDTGFGLSATELAKLSASNIIIGDVSHTGGIVIDGGSPSAVVTLPQASTLANPTGTLTLASNNVEVRSFADVRGRVNVSAPVTVVTGATLDVAAHQVSTEFTASSLTNQGTVVLTNEDGLANGGLTATLTLTSGSFENQAGGVLRFDNGTAVGSRYLNAELLNAGTVNVYAPSIIAASGAQHVNDGVIYIGSPNGDLTVNSDTGSFTSNGIIDIASGQSMTINNGDYFDLGILPGSGTLTFNGVLGDAVIGTALNTATNYNVRAANILFSGTGSLTALGSANLVALGGISSTSTASTLINTSGANGNVTLEAQSGSIGSALNPITVNAGTGMVRATALAAGSDVYLRGTGSRLRVDQIAASNAISLASNGTIEGAGAGVHLISGSVVDLASTAAIGSLGTPIKLDTLQVGVSGSGGSDITLLDVGAAPGTFALNRVVTGGAGDISITSQNRSLALQALVGNEKVATTGNVTLTTLAADQGIVQVIPAAGVSNPIEANSLTIVSAGEIDLVSSDNKVSNFQGTAANGRALSFASANALTVLGASAANADLQIGSAGDMTVSGPVSAGNILLQAGDGDSARMLTVNSAATISATGTTGIQLLADRIDLANAGSIAASNPAASIVLRPLKNDEEINLGATDDANFSLSSLELGKLLATDILIGDASTDGAIIVSAPVTTPGAANLLLQTKQGISLSGALTVGGELAMFAEDGITQNVNGNIIANGTVIASGNDVYLPNMGNRFTSLEGYANGGTTIGDSSPTLSLGTGTGGWSDFNGPINIATSGHLQINNAVSGASDATMVFRAGAGFGLTVAADVSGGDISYLADNMALTGQTYASQLVQLAPVTLTRPIDLLASGSKSPTSLALSNSDLATLNTPELSIGDMSHIGKISVLGSGTLFPSAVSDWVVLVNRDGGIDLQAQLKSNGNIALVADGANDLSAPTNTPSTLGAITAGANGSLWAGQTIYMRAATGIGNPNGQAVTIANVMDGDESINAMTTQAAGNIHLATGFQAKSSNFGIKTAAGAQSVKISSAAQGFLVDSETDVDGDNAFISTTGGLVFGADGRFINAGSMRLAAANISQLGYDVVIDTRATSGNLTLETTSGIGTAAVPLQTSLGGGLFALNTAGGGIFITNNANGNSGLLQVSNMTTSSGDVALVNYGAVVTSGPTGTNLGGVFLTAHSPITIGGPVTATTGVSIQAASSVAGGDNLVINSSVSSTGGAVSLVAGTDVTMNSGASVSAPTIALTAQSGSIGIASGAALNSTGGSIELAAYGSVNNSGTVTGAVPVISSLKTVVDDGGVETPGGLENTLNSVLQATESTEDLNGDQFNDGNLLTSGGTGSGSSSGGTGSSGTDTIGGTGGNFGGGSEDGSSEGNGGGDNAKKKKAAEAGTTDKKESTSNKPAKKLAVCS